ncbi:MAG: S-layer homology domain-containing protein [Clostridia bacterium]|nr:S-layer homology domain-containing protein [Clostridia bacterium]
MKRFVSILLALTMLLGSCVSAFAEAAVTKGDETVRYSFETATFTEYTDSSLNPFDNLGLRFRVKVPNYLGTIEAELNTSEGSGVTDVMVIYVPNDKWDDKCYYSGITASIRNTSGYHVYNGAEYIIKWKEWYNYGFLPEDGGVYVYDNDTLQMNFLQGPGLYTAYATVPFSVGVTGTDDYMEAYAANPESVFLTALGYPFVLILDDTTISYYLENGKLESVASYDWPNLAQLLEEQGHVIEDSPSAFGLHNFTQKDDNKYFRGKLFDLINDESWYMPYVVSVFEYGLMSGYPDNTFKPQADITLAEVITVASKMHDIYYGGSGDFTPGRDWYSILVSYAIGNGIIGDGEFDDYNRKATRGEVARIFANTVPEGRDILVGDPDGDLRLDDSITRAELATLIAKIIDENLRKASE